MHDHRRIRQRRFPVKSRANQDREGAAKTIKGYLCARRTVCRRAEFLDADSRPSHSFRCGSQKDRQGAKGAMGEGQAAAGRASLKGLRQPNLWYFCPVIKPGTSQIAVRRTSARRKLTRAKLNCAKFSYGTLSCSLRLTATPRIIPACRQLPRGKRDAWLCSSWHGRS